MFALIDCNNFYASCERVFQPKLRGKPVIVLSNNDGCVIARSNEVKALGIEMGAPYFQCKEAIRKHNIAVFSSNYTLYGDLSARVMETLREFTSDVEVYSIDEAFCDLSGFMDRDLTAYGHNRFNNDAPYANATTLEFPVATDYTPEIIAYAVQGIRHQCQCHDAAYTPPHACNT